MKHLLPVIILKVGILSFLALSWLASAGNADESTRITMPGPTLGVAWGFYYGRQGAPAETFMPQLRALGGTWTKLYLFWNQLEPQQGHFDFTVVDAFLDQLQSPEEALICIFSSSTWATQRSATVLPPSPATDSDEYYRFIHTLVTHCKGRVRYWQNDSEPNNPIYWAGTPDDFVSQLKVFHRAVKNADPNAVVVLGGYDGIFHPPGMPPIPFQQSGLDFFAYVLKHGKGHFDVFDLRLYEDPYTIPGRVHHIRQMMADVENEKPIICTEYSGPGLFEFSENHKYLPLLHNWVSEVSDQQSPTKPDQSQHAANPVAQLYDMTDQLAPQTLMFMDGCPDSLEQKLRRIQRRDLVMRNVLAFSAGVQKTLFWDLWHDTTDREHVMHLMYGKSKLMEYRKGVLSEHYPAAEAFRMTARAFGVVEHVRRLQRLDKDSIYLFEVTRRDRDPLVVVWDRRDIYSGENEPPINFDLSWNAPAANAIDALGRTVPTQVREKRLHLDVSDTPIFIEPIGH